ncbi:peptidyl-prolyl cis-trans isomerase FKBP7 isoform X2 [Oryzias latipes]|uniref:peptidyl-prolyl cis-trans isomerase FKBP7 isoform X2 n=1 Tax=Oryzias latipes TaxID=8090 RepID=UPI0009D91E69|nr:peptidyl-prolyl cis-trans isomerase FKBP7 isoform X2 [Oryzias latipes]
MGKHFNLKGHCFPCSVCSSSSNGMTWKHAQRLKGPVPPNATVVFEVEVLSVSRGPRSMEAFTLIDLDQDRSLTKAEVKEYLKLEYEKGGKPRDDPFYEKIIADIFRKSDRDRDGLISSKEYNIYEHDEL